MTVMKEKEITYEQAIVKLEKLVEKLEQPQTTLQNVEVELKEAMELIKFCKQQLKGYENEFDNILKEN